MYNRPPKCEIPLGSPKSSNGARAATKASIPDLHASSLGEQVKSRSHAPACLLTENFNTPASPMKLWERILGAGEAGTLKPVKKHHTLKRKTLSQLTKATLGSGNLVQTVRLPPGESRNDWIASNLVDFFNELSLLYGLVVKSAMEKYPNPGDGFPPGFEYRWSQPGKKPLRVSGPEYVDFVMAWVEAQLDNPAIFPVNEDEPWPADFDTYAIDIFRRMFRVFAIIFHRSFEDIEKVEATAHLNTVFKHFCFFCFEFNFLDEKETAALAGPVKVLQADFNSSKAKEQ